MSAEGFVPEEEIAEKAASGADDDVDSDDDEQDDSADRATDKAIADSTKLKEQAHNLPLYAQPDTSTFSKTVETLSHQFQMTS